jgi:hypothetical protein
MTAPSLLDELEMLVKLSDFYESEYPNHSRTSCSDKHPVNADVSGHSCARRNAIFFTRADAAFDALAAMAKRLEAAERKVSRLTAMRYEWGRDAREHLNTFGQHLPASVECLVERFDAATQEGEE